MVMLFESIDPRPYKSLSPVYGRLINTVICMSDRLLSQSDPNPHLTRPPDPRSSHAPISVRVLVVNDPTVRAIKRLHSGCR